MKKKVKGTVLNFDKIKGFGYILIDKGFEHENEKVFCHFSNILKMKFKYLEPNQKVTFFISNDENNLTALDITKDE